MRDKNCLQISVIAFYKCNCACLELELCALNANDSLLKLHLWHMVNDDEDFIYEIAAVTLPRMYYHFGKKLSKTHVLLQQVAGQCQV